MNENVLKPLFTSEGRRRLLQGIGGTTNYRISHVEVGTGDNGKGYTPQADATALRNPVQRASASVEVSPDGKRVHVSAVVGRPDVHEEQNEYKIYEVGFFLTEVDENDADIGSPVLFAIYARTQDEGALLSKTPGTDLLLAFDLIIPDLADGLSVQIKKDDYFKFPMATETQSGLLRLATSQEVTDGTNNEKAVTPATLKRAHSLASADGTNESALVVDAAGHVGIGTIPGRSKLKISQSDSDFADVRFSDSGMGQLEIVGWSKGWSINTKTTSKHLYINRDAHSTSDVYIGRVGKELFVRGSDGYIGIGIGSTEPPRSALDTHQGVMSGAANDYQKAQYTMSGGGTVTWDGPGGRLKWTKRFIAISMERGTTFSAGHINIKQPTSDIPASQVHDGTARSATADGVVLKSWEALYAVHTVGGNESAVKFQVVVYNKSFYAPSNWILVAVVNHDDGTVKLGTGAIVDKDRSLRGGNLVNGIEWVLGYADRIAHSGTWSASGGWGEPKFSASCAYTRNTAGIQKIGNETLDFAIPVGAKTAYMSMLAWSNTGYFDVMLQFGGVWKFHRRVNHHNSVQMVNSGGTHDGNVVVLIATGVNHATHIRLQNRKGRIHFTGLGFSREDMVGSYGTGFVHQDNIVAPAVVKGMVIMWHGNVRDIPVGWALCDGQNGTPDLRGRFVLGHGQGVGLTGRAWTPSGSIGGAETHTLTASQMPKHRHGVLTRQDDYNVSGGKGPSFGRDNGAYKIRHYTGYAGSTKPHNNMPPYYVLVYLMKL